MRRNAEKATKTAKTMAVANEVTEPVFKKPIVPPMATSAAPVKEFVSESSIRLVQIIPP